MKVTKNDKYPLKRWKVEKQDGSTGKWYDYLAQVINDYNVNWSNGDVIKAYGSESVTTANILPSLPAGIELRIDMGGFEFGTIEDMYLFNDVGNTVKINMINVGNLFMNTPSNYQVFFWLSGLNSEIYVETQKVSIPKGVFLVMDDVPNVYHKATFHIKEFDARNNNLALPEHTGFWWGGEVTFVGTTFYFEFRESIGGDVAASNTIDMVCRFIDCTFYNTGTLVNHALNLGVHRPAGVGKCKMYLTRCKIYSDSCFALWQNQNPAYGLYLEIEDCTIISKGLFDINVYEGAVWLCGDSPDSKFIFKGVNTIIAQGYNLSSIGHNGVGSGSGITNIQNLGQIYTNLAKMPNPTFIINPTGFVVDTAVNYF